MFKDEILLKHAESGMHWLVDDSDIPIGPVTEILENKSAYILDMGLFTRENNILKCF